MFAEETQYRSWQDILGLLCFSMSKPLQPSKCNNNNIVTHHEFTFHKPVGED